jgi:hypothetical protein
MEEDTVGACPALGCGNEVDPDERVGAHAGLRDGREQFAQYVQSCVDCEAGKEGGVLRGCALFQMRALWWRWCGGGGARLRVIRRGSRRNGLASFSRVRRDEMHQAVAAYGVRTCRMDWN